MKVLTALLFTLFGTAALAGYGNFPASGGGSGTVTGVTASAPIQSSGGTAPVISCIAASGSVAGCLSAADWTTFNSKQDALTFTGSGNVVKVTSPTLVTPALGTPSALVGTNITGTAASLTAGTATNATNIATTATNSTNATFFPAFVASSSSGNQAADTATGLTFNPSTNTLTTTAFVGALTGAASSNVLKSGDVMTGDLILTTAANGVTIGAAATKSKALYIKPGASGTGIQLENVNNTRKFNIDVSVAGLTIVGQDATNGFISISNVASGGTGVNWFSMGSSGGANPPAWPQAFETISGDGNVTSLTATAFTPLAGASVNGAPIVVLRNRNSTVNTLAEWANTGSSGNLTGGWGTRHVVQTASSEHSDWYAFNRNAGTMQEVVRFNGNGNMSVSGSVPGTPTACGTSPAIAGNNNVFKLTVGTGGTANACVVPFAGTPAWDNEPSCECNNQSTAMHLQLIPTTSQITINGIGLATGTAAAFGAGDVIRCRCGGYR